MNPGHQSSVLVRVVLAVSEVALLEPQDVPYLVDEQTDLVLDRQVLGSRGVADRYVPDVPDVHELARALAMLAISFSATLEPHSPQA